MKRKHTCKIKSALALILTFALFAAALVSCSSKPVAVSYGKSSVTEGMYAYWLSTYKATFVYSYGGGSDTAEFWQQTLSDGTTYADYAEQEILRTVKYFTIASQLFAEYGLKISSSTSERIDADLAEKLDYAGSRAEMNSELARLGLNIDGLRQVYITEEKWQAVYDYLYGEDGIEAPTDAEIDEYYKSNFSRMGIIVLYTEQMPEYGEDGGYVYDSSGAITMHQLTAEERAEKYRTADEIMEKLGSGTEFEELSQNCGDDENASYYQNGRFIGDDNVGIYGSALVEKVKQMQVGDIVRFEDDGIIYIMKKYDLIDRSMLLDCDTEQLSDLSEYVAEKKYREKFSALAETVEVNESVISKYSIEDVPINTYY